VKYLKNIVSRDENAIFILNRFHLSAYVLTIIQDPKFKKEYDDIINLMRLLPVHVFILQLDESEIEKRTLHPERSSAWHKFQQRITEREGFPNKRERYIWQQRLMLELAGAQQIPYSVIKLASVSQVRGTRHDMPGAKKVVGGGDPINSAGVKIYRRKRDLTRVL